MARIILGHLQPPKKETPRLFNLNSKILGINFFGQCCISFEEECMWNIQRMSFYVENLHPYNNFLVECISKCLYGTNVLMSVIAPSDLYKPHEFREF